MTDKQYASPKQAAPMATAGAWGLRYPGRVMDKGMIDTDVAREWQYEDVAERIDNFKAAKAA